LAVVNIIDVSSIDLSEERLWGCNIELPVPESQTEGYAINVAGWVLGRSSPAIFVELVNDGTVLVRVPVDILRSDIVTAFPEVPGAERSGFQITLDLSEVALAFDLLVHTVFEDGSRVQIGVIRGHRSSRRNEVEVVEVSTIPADLSALLRGCNIDLPVSESQTDVYAISVQGWALARCSPAVAVELVDDESVFRRIPIDVQRSDIAAQYPATPKAEKSGFRTTVNVLNLPPEFELFVRVVLRDEVRVPIGVIRARRRSLRSDSQPRLQPLMVTTYGRTGSNWLMRLLGQHPQILTYRPFEYEPRVGSYWMQVLKALSEPASYLQTLNTKLSDEYWWLGRESYPSELVVPDPQIQQWLGRYSIEALTTFCLNRIEEFYDHVAVVQDRSEAIYFAEKYSPAKFARTMIQELYSRPREIILVRDFRDMICSILAYNAKRETVSFGREGVSSDEEFVEHVRLEALSLLRSFKSRSPQVHLLRYEDLIIRPVETLGALLEYLDLNPSSSTIERMIQRASQEAPGMQEHRTSAEPGKSIGRWRRDLDPSLQAVCQEAFTDILEEFGYVVEL
jgi:hypothetical protein